MPNKLTAMKAIRKYCLDCCCGSFHEVRLCPCEECPLYSYRFGKRPETIEQKRRSKEEPLNDE